MLTARDQTFSFLKSYDLVNIKKIDQYLSNNLFFYNNEFYLLPYKDAFIYKGNWTKTNFKFIPTTDQASVFTIHEDLMAFYSKPIFYIKDLKTQKFLVNQLEDFDIKNINFISCNELIVCTDTHIWCYKFNDEKIYDQILITKFENPLSISVSISKDLILTYIIGSYNILWKKKNLTRHSGFPNYDWTKMPFQTNFNFSSSINCDSTLISISGSDYLKVFSIDNRDTHIYHETCKSDCIAYCVFSPLNPKSLIVKTSKKIILINFNDLKNVKRTEDWLDSVSKIHFHPSMSPYEVFYIVKEKKILEYRITPKSFVKNDFLFDLSFQFR